MQLHCPNHLIFKHKLFETDLYKAFAAQVIRADAVTESPMDLQLQQVMPTMVKHVDVSRDTMLGGLRALQSSLSQDITTLAKGLEMFGEQMEEDRFRDREKDHSRTSAPPSPPFPSSTPSISPSAQILAALKTVGNQGSSMFDNATSGGARQKGGVLGGGCVINVDEFLLEKDHQSVAALWKEYDEGIFGRLSVREMIAKSLKKSESQRKRWERRSIIVKEVERLMSARTTSADTVVTALDRFMRKEKLSMAKLQNRIAEAKVSSEDLPLWE
ncbi:hypothetical protein QFC22_006406 [Naganishia vaughanmartiniae]|uniref:Uncharacterized protein n=1 Tax=Naganishia vaughanmartiniae TaxID=1424756 RepID=A0ACC2WK38_9TREE|nr:hypothetical protein QFC22_006406 [Naganishia vaughanmartiniae]